MIRWNCELQTVPEMAAEDRLAEQKMQRRQVMAVVMKGRGGGDGGGDGEVH